MVFMHRDSIYDLCIMRTTLDIDPALLKTAVRVLGTRSKRETVETALRESIAFRRRRELAESLGTFDFTLTAEEIHHLRERD